LKYTLTINQKQALELGMNNVNQVIILGLIAECHSWAEPEIIDNIVYYWTARQKISEELPLLSLKSDSVYRHLKTLADLGLIDYKKVGKKDCVKLTKKGKSYYVGNKSELDENSEINPSKFGNKSEKNSEINPTYKNTNPIRVTKDNKEEKDKKEFSTILNLWNDLAAELNLNIVSKLTSKRKSKLITRLKENQNFLKDFIAAIANIKQSNFLKGQNKRSWKIDFDWLIANDTNFIKVLEGKYTDVTAQAQQMDLSKFGHNNTKEFIEASVVESLPPVAGVEDRLFGGSL